jgi:ABC-type sugar transport system ATPase subunit
MSAVVLQSVSKIYANNITAVRDLNLAVEEGEIVAVLGPSGSGKTTTLRLIAGLETASTGSITIGGRLVSGLPPCKRDVAMVFQRFALYPHLSVRRNLSAGWELRHGSGGHLRRFWAWMSRRSSASQHGDVHELKEKVEVTAKLLGLEKLLERRPFELSGGEQQRVALGRALVCRPTVYLLDEPLSNLDGTLRAEIRHHLHLLQRRVRATMIYVTHDQVEAMILADRVAVMERGEIRQVGQPQEIYARPRDRFVASFVGWPPMNFVDGRVLADSDGKLVLMTPLGRLGVPEVLVQRLASALDAVTLGIRPENIDLEPPCAGLLPMRVMLVEQLGRERMVTLEREGIRIIALDKGEKRECEPGQLLQVNFAMDRAHYFDKSTGLALSAGQPFS